MRWRGSGQVSLARQGPRETALWFGASDPAPTLVLAFTGATIHPGCSPQVGAASPRGPPEAGLLSAPATREEWGEERRAESQRWSPALPSRSLSSPCPLFRLSQPSVSSLTPSLASPSFLLQKH